jgi:hypothetical protein
MRRFTALMLIYLILHSPARGQSAFTITLKHNSQTEQQTKAQLERLLKTYDHSRWIFTSSIEIDDTQRPHSHPVLTLSTRHLKDDELLNATFAHEQFHWWAERKAEATRQVLAELRIMFPKVPAGAPEGADDENSTCLHLIVCSLEYSALKDLYGDLKARQVMEFWANDHYKWIYRTVLERQPEIRSLLFKHGVLPIGKI